MTVAEDRGAGDRQGRSALAARLRELRTRTWPEVRVTQGQVAEALGLSVPLVSSWESGTGTAIPTEDRLRAYACFFATRRSLDGGHGRLLEVRELTEAEEQVRRQLVDELVRLREDAVPRAGEHPRMTGALGGRFYYFPDGQQVRIIGRTLPSHELLRQLPDPNQVTRAVGVLRSAVGHTLPVAPGTAEGRVEEALDALKGFEAVRDAFVLLDELLTEMRRTPPDRLPVGGAEIRRVREALSTFRMPGVQYANRWHPNTIYSLWNGDMDAAVELSGHVRAENPGSDVRWLRHEDVTADDLTGHVILLGGGDQFMAGFQDLLSFFSERLDLPVEIHLPDGGDDEYDMEFQVLVDDEGHMSRAGTRRETHAPRFQMDGENRRLVDGQPQIVYDVALLARQANPLSTSATVTICTGIFSRGTYGAVRALTDERLRARNEQYLADRFGLGDFSLLLHVPVFPGADGAQTVTPDLDRPFTRIRSTA